MLNDQLSALNESLSNLAREKATLQRLLDQTSSSNSAKQKADSELIEKQELLIKELENKVQTLKEEKVVKF
jgi:hypothetical protein